MIGLDGTNPYDTLQRAADRQTLDSSADPAAVLAWRIQPEQRHDSSTVPALPTVPKTLDADDYWHRYFDRRHELIARHADDLRTQVTQWTSATAPTWAGPLIARDRDLAADLAVFRAGHGIPDTDSRPSGPRRADYAGWKAQRELDRRVETVLGSADSATGRWHDWATAIDPRITTDPAWPQTAATLDAAELAGLNRPAVAHIADQEPLPTTTPRGYRHHHPAHARVSKRPPRSRPSRPRRRPSTTHEPSETDPGLSPGGPGERADNEVARC